MLVFASIKESDKNTYQRLRLFRLDIRPFCISIAKMSGRRELEDFAACITYCQDDRAMHGQGYP